VAESKSRREQEARQRGLDCSRNGGTDEGSARRNDALALSRRDRRRRSASAPAARSPSIVVLGITGLNITFGKHLLLPLIGYDAFAAFSEAAKYVHNFTSFAFVLGLVLIVVIFIKDNIPDKTDIEWFRQGGGFIKSKHAPARRFNAGEKLVFWAALGAGILVSVSGFLLLFPFYLTGIAGMQLAQVVHAVIAVLFVALILGHIYIGTLGMEGAFEAMWTGEVDYNWAKEHHDLWLGELAKRGAAFPRHPSATPAE
jgi:formate dehydrogenase subunit gamma